MVVFMNFHSSVVPIQAKTPLIPFDTPENTQQQAV